MFLSDVLSPYALRKTAPLVASRKQQGLRRKYPATTMVGCALQHTPVNPIESSHLSHETLAVLVDWCLVVRPVDLSKRVIEMGWKPDERGGEGCSNTCKAREN